MQQDAIDISRIGHWYYEWFVYISINKTNVGNVFRVKKCVHGIAIKDFTIIVALYMVFRIVAHSLRVAITSSSSQKGMPA